LITAPNQQGVPRNARLMEATLAHVAPALEWR
jgi:hypothetical protein